MSNNSHIIFVHFSSHLNLTPLLINSVVQEWRNQLSFLLVCGSTDCGHQTGRGKECPYRRDYRIQYQISSNSYYCLFSGFITWLRVASFPVTQMHRSILAVTFFYSSRSYSHAQNANINTKDSKI